MLFNSAIFGMFILIVFPLYALARGTSFARVLLLVASYAFYANWDVRYLPLLWLSTLVYYTAGRRMAATDDARTRRLWLLVSLITNLGLLGVFKYGNFLLETASPVWNAIGIDPPMLPGGIPVGISFYTFQTLSYTIDVYRRQLEPCDRPLDFAVFVAFFPQLVAGPIVRASELLPQLKKLPPIRGEDVAAGIQRFALGLMKKIVIADNVGLFVDQVFAAPGEYSAFTLWFAAYGFALQIYCDFSGYTDMALGLGRAFGMRIPENFDVPYLAVSITDFWRRWHMTLSRWLRDYLYIPLGGSHGSRAATYRNLMITMLLGGLWHGAAWTFVLWGGLHGAWLAIERACGINRMGRDRPIGIARASLHRLVTFHLVCLAWVVFRAPGFEDLATYVGRMFTAWTWTGQREIYGLQWALLLAVLVAGQWVNRRYRLREIAWDRLPAPLQGLGVAGLLLAAGLFQVDEVAFIYFQF